MHLLDINLLIAVVDPFHVHHAAALDWFTGHRHEGWATCPVTENGFIRILSNSKYPGGLESADAARMLLLTLCAQPGHQFWPDSLSLTDPDQYPSLPASKHLTDFYLLALAIRHRAAFVTFDKRIDPGLLSRGTQAMLCLGQ